MTHPTTDPPTTDAAPDAGDTTRVVPLDDPTPTEPVVIQAEPAPDRLHRWWAACLAEGKTIPEAFTNPPTLMEGWDYACRAGISTNPDGGPLRRANQGWAAVTTPIAAVLMVALWARARLGRAIAFTVCLLLICTGLAQIPVLDWFIPNALNITAW